MTQILLTPLRPRRRLKFWLFAMGLAGLAGLVWTWAPSRSLAIDTARGTVTEGQGFCAASATDDGCYAITVCPGSHATYGR